MRRLARALVVIALVGLVVYLPPGTDDDPTPTSIGPGGPPESLGYSPTTTVAAPPTTVTPIGPPVEPTPPTTWLFLPDFEPARRPIAGPFFALGDSVMLGAKAELQAAGIDLVNAAVSRQLAIGTGILRGVSDHATLVVHLGTNGPASEATVDSLMQAAVDAGFDNILVVTIQLPSRYNYETSMNDTLRAAAEKWGALVLDWEALSDENPGFLARDGIHLTSAGRAGYTELIAEALFPDGPAAVDSTSDDHPQSVL